MGPCRQRLLDLHKALGLIPGTMNKSLKEERKEESIDGKMEGLHPTPTHPPAESSTPNAGGAGFNRELLE